jgi:hypothetical protein
MKTTIVVEGEVNLLCGSLRLATSSLNAIVRLRVFGQAFGGTVLRFRKQSFKQRTAFGPLSSTLHKPVPYTLSFDLPLRPPITERSEDGTIHSQHTNFAQKFRETIARYVLLHHRHHESHEYTTWGCDVFQHTFRSKVRRGRENCTSHNTRHSATALHKPVPRNRHINSDVDISTSVAICVVHTCIQAYTACFIRAYRIRAYRILRICILHAYCGYKGKTLIRPKNCGETFPLLDQQARFDIARLQSSCLLSAAFR